MATADLAPLPTPPGPCLVGFSGGLDSTALLHAVAANPAARAQGLRAIHVHHGLHADADAWSEHCRAQCAALGLPLTLVRVQVRHDTGLGLEAAAREARYAAFADALQPDEVLALAHHRDDQAETVLLRLLRASASEGLAAMRASRPFAAGRLWRPLIDRDRASLLRYAQANALRWIEDPSNEGHGPDRNFLRHRVLPLLAERWPQAAASLARSAELLAEDAALLRAETATRLAHLQGADPHTLSLPALLAHAPAWRARLLRAWIESLRLPPLPGSAIALIERELLPTRADAEPEYRWADARLQRWRDLLHAAPGRPPLPADWNADWDGRAPLSLPTGDQLCFVVADGSPMPPAGCYRVRARQGGERLRLPGRTQHHTLKHVLQAVGVPPWERERLPLLCTTTGELLAAGDQVLSADFDAWCRAHGCHLAWR